MSDEQKEEQAESGEPTEHIITMECVFSVGSSDYEKEHIGKAFMLCTARVTQGNGVTQNYTDMPEELLEVTGKSAKEIAAIKKDYAARVALSYFGAPRAATKPSRPKLILPNKGLVV